jgi:hypothetical protein
LPIGAARILLGMTPEQREKAERLLEAQIAFLKAELAADRFAGLVETEVDHALEAAETLTLNQVVTREQIKATAQKYATRMEIHGSIPELIGEIADRVYRHPAHRESLIGEVVGRHHVAALVGKLFEMQALRERLMHRLSDSPLTVAWLSSFLYRVASDFLHHNRERVERVPGVAPLLNAGGQLAGKVLGDPARDANLRLREFAERSAGFLLRHAGQPFSDSLDEAPMFDAVMELWDDHAGEPVSEVVTYVSQADLEDLLVIGYEFWLDFRDSEYLRALIDEGVDFFFDKYGDFALRELLEDMGIGRADLVEEAMRFAPRVIAVLDETGLLDKLLRRRLEPFFFSDEVLALLGA